MCCDGSVAVTETNSVEAYGVMLTLDSEAVHVNTPLLMVHPLFFITHINSH